MGLKEKLVLFLIGADPGIKSIYLLDKIFDRAMFPAEMGKSIDILLKKNLILITNYFENKTASKYGITQEGQEYLNKEFNMKEILGYVQTFDYPDLIVAHLKNSQ